jgi:hypothetical protein
LWQKEQRSGSSGLYFFTFEQASPQGRFPEAMKPHCRPKLSPAKQNIAPDAVYQELVVDNFESGETTLANDLSRISQKANTEIPSDA